MTPRTTTEQVIQAYEATGSVWKAGKRLGISGQTVHERLTGINYSLPGRKWTEEEIDEMRTLIINKVPLGEVARRLGRPYAGVACKASELGIRANQAKAKKIPRGAGYDKVSIGRHLRALEQSGMKATQYARAHRLNVETLVRALQRHYPERWDTYVATHSPLPKKACLYCDTEFIPANGKQIYCDRNCGNQARTDARYFGGRRRETIGLAEGVCQLCGRTGIKGLSSHHYLGKENDEDNAYLIALCQGCHKLVTLLAGRSFVDDPVAWEALITLCWFRKHGHEIFDRIPDGKALYVGVNIEVEEEDEVAA